MTQGAIVRSNAITALCGIVAILSGCSDPRFKHQQKIRNERITYHLNDYAAHDAAGMDRVRQTLDLNTKLNEQRAEHLTYTCDLVRDTHERDVRRWNEDQTRRLDSLRAIFQGKPDQVPDTWAKMVY